MVDVFDRRTRSRVMAAIRSKDTSPERTVRSFLHRKGFRFRLHVRHLAGCPDIVLTRHRVALFVHGCFWHQHSRCQLAAVPGSNADFWKKKLDRNRIRDEEQIALLRQQGWRVGIFWECAARKGVVDAKTLLALVAWLRQSSGYMEFPRVPLRPRRTSYRRARMR